MSHLSDSASGFRLTTGLYTLPDGGNLPITAFVRAACAVFLRSFSLFIFLVLSFCRRLFPRSFLFFLLAFTDLLWSWFRRLKLCNCFLSFAVSEERFFRRNIPNFFRSVRLRPRAVLDLERFCVFLNLLFCSRSCSLSGLPAGAILAVWRRDTEDGTERDTGPTASANGDAGGVVLGTISGKMGPREADCCRCRCRCRCSTSRTFLLPFRPRTILCIFLTAAVFFRTSRAAFLPLCPRATLCIFLTAAVFFRTSRAAFLPLCPRKTRCIFGAACFSCAACSFSISASSSAGVVVDCRSPGDNPDTC